MNPYREEFLKTAGKLSGLLALGKSMWRPATRSGRFLHSAITNSAMIGGFNALSDEQMKERYGFLGTFGRKMIDPRTYVMAGALSVAAPALNKATLGAGKTLAGLDRLGGRVPLVNLITRPLGAVGRLTELFTSKGARIAANQAGGAGKYIWHGFREGGANKDMYFNTIKALRASPAYSKQFGGVGGTLKRLFSDADSQAYDAAAQHLARKSQTSFRWQNRRYLNKLVKNPQMVVDPTKFKGPVTNVAPGMTPTLQNPTVPFSDLKMNINADGTLATQTPLLGGKPSPIIDMVNKKRGEMGVKGFAPAMNPFSIMGVPAIAGMMSGYENGPWAPQMALISEDASIYKPFGSKRGVQASQFKTY